MLYYKTKEDIDIIKQSSEILAHVHAIVASNIKEGVATIDLDLLAYKFITDKGGHP